MPLSTLIYLAFIAELICFVFRVLLSVFAIQTSVMKVWNQLVLMDKLVLKLYIFPEIKV